MSRFAPKFTEGPPSRDSDSRKRYGSGVGDAIALCVLPLRASRATLGTRRGHAGAGDWFSGLIRDPDASGSGAVPANLIPLVERTFRYTNMLVTTMRGEMIHGGQGEALEELINEARELQDGQRPSIHFRTAKAVRRTKSYGSPYRTIAGTRHGIAVFAPRDHRPLASIPDAPSPSRRERPNLPAIR